MLRASLVVTALAFMVTSALGGCSGGALQPRSETNAGSSGSAGAAAAPSSAGGGGGSGEALGNVYVDEIVLGTGGGPLRCLPRPLPLGATGGPAEGRSTCTIAELHFGACDCSRPGRAPLASALLSAVKQKAKAGQSCGETSGIDCDTGCGCEIVQPTGTPRDLSSDLYACLNDAAPPPSLAGFCVIDQEHLDASGRPEPIGSAALVASCPADTERLIRFIGEGVPDPGAMVYLACPAASLQ